MTMAGHYIDLPVGEGIAVKDSFRRAYILRESGRDENVHIVAGKDSITDLTFIVLPGVDAAIEVDVDIVGEGASVRIAGLYVSGSGEKVSIHTCMRHRVPGASSHQIFTGIAGGSARVSFRGEITVAPDAQKTQAYQKSRSLLLSGDARVETMPQLEIYADDVKCSHGATVGSLNQEEQFYMRSRGIPENEAKVLQMMSFLSPVLEGLPERDALAEELENAIRSIL